MKTLRVGAPVLCVPVLRVPALCVPLALAAAVTAVPASADEAASSVVVNEVESNGDRDGDWVELANTDPNSPVDVSGWGIIDNDASHDLIVLPGGTEIESGGYLVVPTEPSFGLGGDDSVTLTAADGTVVDGTSWSGHAATTWGRVPDQTGDFAVTGEPTRGARNVAEGEGGGDATSAWPYDPLEITDTTLTGEYTEDFAGEDMSGIDVGPDGTVYVVNNDRGTLYVLSPVVGENAYTVDSRYQLRYPDGTGLPDAEGVTVGPNGAVFVSTERDNGDKDVSRPSVLRFEVGGAAGSGADGGAELVATDEWNLAGFTGALESNGGLETVSWIGDAGDAPLFAVGVEETGDVLFVSLADADPVLVQRYSSPFEGVMASDYDAVSGELTILCDEVCGGGSQVLTSSDPGVADFAPVGGGINARPAGTENLANEGYARTVDADGTVRYLWADDGATGGIGLRGAVVVGRPAGSTGATGSLPGPPQSIRAEEPPASGSSPAPGSAPGPSRSPAWRAWP